MLLLSSCVPSSDPDGPFVVIHITDGDTLEINTGDKIRLSGIDAPEKGECHFQESKERLKELVLEKEIYLEHDYSNKGKYGRLLRYVHSNKREINSIMISEGKAKVYDKYAYDTKKYSEFKKLEAVARELKLGVWSCKKEIKTKGPT
tara:strand:- start:2314 stop:2754 length:441 start_codon:yes stop_codon:yes gene_type:complete